MECKPVFGAGRFVLDAPARDVLERLPPDLTADVNAAETAAAAQA